MATLKNPRDIQLRDTVPRLIDPANSSILSITASSNVLQYKPSASNPTALEPSTTITLTAVSSREGVYTWSLIGTSTGASLASTNNTTVLTYTNSIATDTITVRATITTTAGRYITDSEYKDIVLTKQVPALSTRTLVLYREAPSALTAPAAVTGPLTYNYSTDTYTGLVGWSTTAPIAPTYPVYSTSRSVSTYDTSSSYPINTMLGSGWSAPATITQNGVSPPLLSISTTGFAYIFKDNVATTSDSPDIILTANLVNSSVPITWTATARSASDISLGVIASINGTTGTTKTLTSAQFTLAGNINVKSVKITATAGTLTDSITIYRGDGGSDALNLILTNESHNVPSANDGSSTDLTGATTLIKVFKGIEDVTSLWTITASVLTGIVTPTTIGGTAANPTYTVSSISTDVATVRLRATKDSVILDKVFTITKSKAGVTGTGDNVDIIYARYATQPSTPTPSTGVPTGTTPTWYSDPSSATGELTMWSSAGIRAAGVGNYTWDTPVSVSGTSIVEVTIFKRT
jgi:hypothetical protein